MPTRVVFVLHAHLPFVRHTDVDDALEERWLFEAITETYLPLLDVFTRLADDGLQARCAVSLSPTLLAMLGDELLRARYLRYLDQLRALADAEVRRTRRDPRLRPVATLYRDRLRQAHDQYVRRWGRDLAAAFRRVADAGVVELATCAATHAVLPLLAPTPALQHAEIALAAAEYRRWLERPPCGFWLPECAWVPGLDTTLAAAGFRWFVVDAHGLLNATPRPVHGVHAPVITPGGMAAFARDPESAAQVWSSVEGYPGDPWYRDFYRDVGFDLPADYVRRYVPNGPGTHTGLKYHRVTGPGADKAPYEPARAAERVALHADHFVAARRAQGEALAPGMDGGPMIVCPYDAELFGHWWFEGPAWLEAVLRRLAADEALEAASPSDVLAAGPRLQRADPAASTWGVAGHQSVWIDRQTDWVYPHLHAAGARLTALVPRWGAADALTRRALAQALRELLLAAASDWPFMLSRDTAADYAGRRAHAALAACHALCEQVERGRIDAAALAGLEARDNCFPEVGPELLT